MRRVAPLFLAAAFAALVPGCSILLDKSKDQCSADGDCARFGASYTCVNAVCVLGSATTDGGPSADGSAAGDACTPSPKVTNVDFYNEKCTNSSCVPFDNCARLGLCDGGLPALVAPPEGGVK